MGFTSTVGVFNNLTPIAGRLAVIALAVVTTSCHRAPPYYAAMRKIAMASTTPPTSQQPPIYVATDYGKPGQPALTPRERALIRTTLAVVKPCQRELLRYAFPEDAAPDWHLVLFFVESGKPIFDAHVLWQGNLVYNEGHAFAVPEPSIPSDIRNDIANTPCSNGETFPQALHGPPIASPLPLQTLEPTATAAGALRILHRFAGGNDGSIPSGGLTLVNSELYGVTRWGGVSGADDSCRGVGCGTVFESTLDGMVRVIYAFKGPPDGQWPVGDLLAFNGGLYGITQNGGTDQLGTVFAISLSGFEGVIHSFKGGDDGSHPSGDLASIGVRLYGTTDNGGTHDAGTVFEISPAGERILHSFDGDKDGAEPSGGLLTLGGALYGTTLRLGPRGGGTLFRLTPDGAFSIVHAFDVDREGSEPGGLTSVNGVIYGTTYSSNVGSHGGLGSIFRITSAGQLQTLYVFPGGNGGENPGPGALTYFNGELYGATVNGGIGNAGTLFVVTTDGRKSLLRRFVREVDGANPFSGFVLVGRTLYGALAGGDKNKRRSPGCCGTIFAFDVK